MRLSRRDGLRVGVALLLSWGTAPALAGEEAPNVAAERLEQRAHEVLLERDSARRGAQVSLPEIRAQMLRITDSLEALIVAPSVRARLDSVETVLLRQVGDVSIRLDDEARALDAYARSIAVAKRSGKLHVEARAQIGFSKALGAAGEPEQAIDVLKGLIPLCERLPEKTHLLDVYVDLAHWLSDTGRMTEANEVCERALALARELGDDAAAVATMNTRAGYLRFVDRNQEAIVVCDSALALAERIRSNYHARARLHLQRASALQVFERFDEALESLAAAETLGLASGNKRHLVSVQFARANLFLRAGRTELCLRQVDRLLADQTDETEERFRVRLINLRGVALAEAGRFAEAETLLTNALGRFEARRDRVTDEQNRAGAFLRGGELYASIARCLLARGATTEAWAMVERGRGALFRERMGRPPASPDSTLARLQRFLAASNGALVLFNDPNRNPLVAFVLTPDSLTAVTMPSTAYAADARIAVELMSANATDDECAPALRRLGELLAAPLTQFIPSTTERLSLSPPSDLLGFPFEALPWEGGSSLGDRFAVSYLPSATAWESLLEQAAPAEGMLVLADPAATPAAAGVADPRETSRSIFDARLPHARAEARAIAISGAEVLTGEDATEARLLRALDSRPSVLHFATHAVVDAPHPERSGLLLAGEEAFLTAADVESLSLGGDLVVLSGCRTSGGQVYLGEGTFGLARSFHLAGARTVVTSLWDVEDLAASRLMTHFYDGMRAGKPCDLALRDARRAVAATGASHRDRSAFQVSGVGDRPVAALAGHPLANSSRRWLSLGALAAIGVGFVFWRIRGGRRGGLAK